MKQKHKITVSWLALILTIIISGTILYWTVTPLTPVITVSPIKVVNKTIARGEPLLLQYNFCKNVPTTEGTITRFLQDEQLIFLPEVKSNFPLGCQDITLRVDLPANIPPDHYTYNADISYRVNPIKVVHYTFQSEGFVVE
jgi:hypothetical protein